eukprot:scaffold17_cov354-Pavlova_lutheri.AAC.2
MSTRSAEGWLSLSVAAGVGMALGAAAAAIAARKLQVDDSIPSSLKRSSSSLDNVASIVVDPYAPHPRSDYLSWEDYFMALAVLSAMRSKDPNRQVRSPIHALINRTPLRSNASASSAATTSCGT